MELVNRASPSNTRLTAPIDGLSGKSATTYSNKNFIGSEALLLANNRSNMASIARSQVNNISNTPHIYGEASAIHGDGMAGVAKKTANNLSFNTLFPTTLASYEQQGLANKVRSLYGGDNPAQNAADIEAYAETPLFDAKTITHGDVFRTCEIASAALGVTQLLQSAPKLYHRQLSSRFRYFSRSFIYQ